VILFVVDQIAGAEYILPLIQRWQAEGYSDWRICSSSISQDFLLKKNVPSLLIGENTKAEIATAIAYIQPDVALLSASAGSALEQTARRQLRELKIPCIQFIDTWVNYALRFRSETGAIDFPDKILTLDENARRDMMFEGIPDSLIRIIGQPYFEARYNLMSKMRGLGVGGGRVLLVTQPLSVHVGKKYGYDEMDFVSGCLEAWRQSAQPWGMLDIVIHPAEDPAVYHALLGRYSPEISIVKNDDLDILKYTLVVGMYSSLLVQAFFANVPTVSFQPDALGDMCHLSKEGHIRRFTQIDGLAALFDNVFDSQPTNGAIPSSPLVSQLIGSCDRLERLLRSFT
jgi:hypothetical protein